MNLEDKRCHCSDAGRTRTPPRVLREARSRHHLPERSRATPRPSAAGHCDPARCRSGQPKHQAGLQGRIPQLQPEPQLAAGLHHRIPAAPAAARAHRRGLPAARPATCIAECPRTRRSTSVAPATSRVKPSQANAHRPAAMCESDENYVPLNDGYHWRATRTRPRPVKPSRNCRRAHQVPPHYRLHRSR